ncbi:hypothetical protein RV134_370003 [Roseovarius sp. EC-HK134]|nr:hypothetical protein RV134_370003 [Roseovarius sp. EC-HK134]
MLFDCLLRFALHIWRQDHLPVIRFLSQQCHFIAKDALNQSVIGNMKVGKVLLRAVSRPFLEHDAMTFVMGRTILVNGCDVRALNSKMKMILSVRDMRFMVQDSPAFAQFNVRLRLVQQKTDYNLSHSIRDLEVVKNGIGALPLRHIFPERLDALASSTGHSVFSSTSAKFFVSTQTVLTCLEDIPKGPMGEIGSRDTVYTPLKKCAVVLGQSSAVNP